MIVSKVVLIKISDPLIAILSVAGRNHKPHSNILGDQMTFDSFLFSMGILWGGSSYKQVT